MADDEHRHPERARTARVVKIEWASAARKEHDCSPLALCGRAPRMRERVARRAAAVRPDRHHLAAAAGRRSEQERRKREEHDSERKPRKISLPGPAGARWSQL